MRENWIDLNRMADKESCPWNPNPLLKDAHNRNGQFTPSLPNKSIHSHKTEVEKEEGKSQLQFSSPSLFYLAEIKGEASRQQSYWASRIFLVDNKELGGGGRGGISVYFVLG